MDVVHFSLNLPQEVEVLGMTKGRVALPFGVVVVTTTSQALFIPDSTCRRQVRLLPMNKPPAHGFGFMEVVLTRTLSPIFRNEPT